jgi:hypothetical protein
MEILLRNRYRADVKLVSENDENTKWSLVVPDADYQFIGLNYEGTADNPHYVSIDPPGGPYLMLGENCVIPYCSTVELTFTIKKIYEENGKWMLDIEGLEKKRDSE